MCVPGLLIKHTAIKRNKVAFITHWAMYNVMRHPEWRQSALDWRDIVYLVRALLFFCLKDECGCLLMREPPTETSWDYGAAEWLFGCSEIYEQLLWNMKYAWLALITFGIIKKVTVSGQSKASWSFARGFSIHSPQKLNYVCHIKLNAIIWFPTTRSHLINFSHLFASFAWPTPPHAGLRCRMQHLTNWHK